MWIFSIPGFLGMFLTRNRTPWARVRDNNGRKSLAMPVSKAGTTDKSIASGVVTEVILRGTATGFIERIGVDLLRLLVF
jgi:hypothetical protein